MIENRIQLRLLKIYYFTQFGALGALFPFLPLFFVNRKLSAGELSWLMALIPISSLLVPPFWAALADSRQRRSLFLALASFGCGISLLGLYASSSFAAYLSAMAAFCFFRAPVVSLVDAIAHALLAEDRLRYALIRVWGSIGFAIFALLSGVLKGATHSLLLLGGSGGIYLVSAIVALGLKQARRDEKVPVGLPVIGLLRQPAMILLLLATASYYAGHSTFDVYFGLHLKALHHGEAFVGLAWAVGVSAEVGVLLFAHRVLHRVASGPLLVLSATAAALRWWLLASAESQVALLCIQPLHGLTFGLWYVSMVKQLHDRAPEAVRATVHSVAMAAMGLGMVAGYLAGGELFERYGGSTLYRIASLCAVAATLLYVSMMAWSPRIRPGSAS
jgi:predicted MFS family arabinose efflux permease